MTKSTDILIAIEGLAKRMEQLLDDTYICGIWRHHYSPRSLVWEALHPGVRRQVFLSWSWTSRPSPVTYNLLGSETLRAREKTAPTTWHAEIVHAGLSPNKISIRGRLGLGDLGLFEPHRKKGEICDQNMVREFMAFRDGTQNPNPCTSTCDKSNRASF